MGQQRFDYMFGVRAVRDKKTVRLLHEAYTLVLTLRAQINLRITGEKPLSLYGHQITPLKGEHLLLCPLAR